MKKKGNTIILVSFSILVIALGLFEIFFWFGTSSNDLDDAKDKFITVQNNDIYYTVKGNGPPVLLIHSGSWSGVEYDGIIEQLKSNYTVYAVDMPGFGRSDKPQTSYTVSYLTEQMSGFIDKFPEKEFHLVGASVGGSIALQLAANHPKQIKTLTLIDPFGFGDDINQTAVLAQLPILSELVLFPNRFTFNYILNHGLLSNKALDDDYRDKLFTTTKVPKAQRAKLSLLRSTITGRGVHKDVRTAVDEAAKKVKQPVLLIWGEHDTYAPFEQSEAALKIISKSQLKSLPKAGHFAHMEAPQQVAKYINSFLKNKK
ncbi:MAG: alpha/beta hydrolase [bacterium]|nr:alpha/beta hydrolase [bacterium]